MASGASSGISIADLDSSTEPTLAPIPPDMIVPGTIVVFDDFINYHGWEEGEFKAFMEFVTARQLAFEYVAYNRTGGQVAVRILGADDVTATAR